MRSAQLRGGDDGVDGGSSVVGQLTDDGGGLIFDDAGIPVTET